MTWTAASLLVLATVAADAPTSKPESVTLTGQVVELAEALKSRGVPADADAVAGQVVLRAEDGMITPLLPDEASRALFRDGRLRNRPAEIQARRHASLPYLQVITFKVEEDGRMGTPEYYCDVCTISVRYPQICPCCQGPMELRMKPESD